MEVAIVLQIPQTTVNCRFSRIHALNELGLALQRQKRKADTILLHSCNTSFVWKRHCSAKDKPAVAKCSDCGSAIWADCRLECCGESFCELCYPARATLGSTAHAKEPDRGPSSIKTITYAMR